MTWCLIKILLLPVRRPTNSPVSVLTQRLVSRFIEKNRLPHLLFYGPPGTGKTSTILAVARRIYGADYRKQILEVNRMLLASLDP